MLLVPSLSSKSQIVTIYPPYLSPPLCLGTYRHPSHSFDQHRAAAVLFSHQTLPKSNSNTNLETIFEKFWFKFIPRHKYIYFFKGSPHIYRSFYLLICRCLNETTMEIFNSWPLIFSTICSGCLCVDQFLPFRHDQKRNEQSFSITIREASTQQHTTNVTDVICLLLFQSCKILSLVRAPPMDEISRIETIVNIPRPDPWGMC